MNNLLNILRAEFYKQLLNKIWFIFLLFIFGLVVALIFRSLNQSIIPGIQIGVESYNPYFELISSGLNLLAVLILPTVLAIYIFINLKQNENYKNWIYGFINQKPYYYSLGKLFTIILVWFCFLVLLSILFIIVSLTVIKFYPSYFEGYEIKYQYLIIYFLKSYLSSLGSIALIYLANLFIKSKPITLIFTLFLPFICLFFSEKSLFFPLSYSYQSTFWYGINYINHIKMKTNEEMRFDFNNIITGYELLSIIIFILVVAYLYFNQKTIIKYLTKNT